MQRVYRILLEMASGNFFYRLEHSGKNDSMEALEVVLNMLAEEIQESLLHQSYVNSKGTMRHIVQMGFMLDGEGIIQLVNQKACGILSYRHADMIKKPFDTFLTKDSKKKWQDTWKKLQEKDLLDTSLELSFRTSKELQLSNSCYITTIKGRTIAQTTSSE